MDDDSKGLATKARFAEEYKFHTVADGHEGFQAKEFRTAMEKMIETDSVDGMIIVLDTLKKFVNPMDKKESSDFTKVIRRFVLKGGTVIALAHANKNPGKDGKIVYSGTTDIIDDFDCGYTLSTVSENIENKVKIVEFENIKRRGNVAITASYSYAFESLNYDEMLLSVQEIDPKKLQTIKYTIESKEDAEVIKAIEVCVKEGTDTKMKLAAASADRANVSQRLALKIIEKYTGGDPIIHRWSFETRKHGAKVYVLLDPSSGQPTNQDSTAS